jgi:hypothetical protein
MKKLTVQIAEADLPNKNGRVYPREVLQKVIKEVEGKDPCRLFGTIGMPADDVIDPAKISHSISNLYLTEDGALMGTVMILETPSGKIAENLLDIDPSRQFRMAGIGKLEDNEDGTTTVTDFRLLSVNLVRDGA